MLVLFAMCNKARNNSHRGNSNLGTISYVQETVLVDGCQWLMPVIPATQKVEIRRIDKFCGLTVS
jgi:hypothetical protein